MPTSAYSTYQDPDTGETKILPNFSSNSIGYSATDMRKWVESGKIPISLYDASEAHNRHIEESMARYQAGQPAAQFLECGDCKPWELIDHLLSHKGDILGERVIPETVWLLTESDPDIVWLFFVRNIVNAIKSQDPLPIHFYVARKVLKDRFNIEDSKAVDILSRYLLEHCDKLSFTLKSLSHPAFEKHPADIKDLEDRLPSKDGKRLQLDDEFIQHVKSIGPAGKKMAAKMTESSTELYLYYKENSYPFNFRRRLWELWIPTRNEEGIYENVSKFLIILGTVLWDDLGKRLWRRDAEQVPALAKPLFSSVVKPLLSPNNKKVIKQQENQIVCCDQTGTPLFYAPTIDPDMIALLQKGVNGLSSLTGHKLLRWQIKTGFEQWCREDSDPRLIEIDGGYSRIAELAGCSSSKEIAKVKEILHAQAHGQFVFPDNSRGNMIILRVLERYRNTEPSKIRLILGDMLFPTFIFRIGKNEGRRLIPIGDLPPLHGSKNSHAFQAQLQLLVFEEFSNQSDRIAEQGAAHIPLDKWRQMAEESGLKADKVESVISYWCQPDLINCFLDKQGDEYCLSSYYDKAQRFLIQQGKQRISNSQRGKASAAKREKDRSGPGEI